MDKILKQLERKYPDITWELDEPAEDVLKDFGDGMILSGSKDGRTKEFFLLRTDKDRMAWGDVIANNLNGEA